MSEQTQQSKARSIIEDAFKDVDLDDLRCAIILGRKGSKPDYVHNIFKLSIDWEHLGWIIEECEKDYSKRERGISKELYIYDSVVEGFADMIKDQIAEEFGI